MTQLILAFATLCSLAFCVHRAICGPQKQFARVALGLAAAGAVPTALAYPNEQSALLYVALAFFVLSALVQAVMVGSSMRWTFQATSAEQPPQP